MSGIRQIVDTQEIRTIDGRVRTVVVGTRKKFEYLSDDAFLMLTEREQRQYINDLQVWEMWLGGKK